MGLSGLPVGIVFVFGFGFQELFLDWKAKWYQTCNSLSEVGVGEGFEEDSQKVQSSQMSTREVKIALSHIYYI